MIVAYFIHMEFFFSKFNKFNGCASLVDVVDGNVSENEEDENVEFEREETQPSALIKLWTSTVCFREGIPSNWTVVDRTGVGVKKFALFCGHHKWVKTNLFHL